VVAKDELTREGLKQQLALHTVERAYQAIVVGVPESSAIQTLYGRHPHSRLRFSSRVVRGRTAITLVAVSEVLAGGAASLVRCQLKTGRTHQIRVHLSEQRAAPVLGDPLYGRGPQSGLVANVAQELGRQALHAERLGFEHPITKQWHSFSSPLPEDMQRALMRLRGKRKGADL
jgi:23S rRNA pseudouridine1911/1915/1917 synthase